MNEQTSCCFKSLWLNYTSRRFILFLKIRQVFFNLINFLSNILFGNVIFTRWRLDKLVDNQLASSWYHCWEIFILENKWNEDKWDHKWLVSYLDIVIISPWIFLYDKKNRYSSTNSVSFKSFGICGIHFVELFWKVSSNSSEVINSFNLIPFLKVSVCSFFWSQ